MGAGGSKPAPSSSQHVFASETPVQFSQELVESLQASSETDSSRAKTLELHIQNRVAAELEKIQKRESEVLAEIEKKFSEQPPETGVTKSAAEKDLGRETVVKEIDELKKRLTERHKLVEVDKDVSKAKESLVSCLRLNDRRPLDCWKEVEDFRKQVGRLEEQFVEKVIS